MDLTVPDADRVRDFYASVVGWTPDPVPMGDYSDYNMLGGGGGPTAGICHKRGVNADLPSVWMIYIAVEDLDESIRQCNVLGGKVLTGPNQMGGAGRYCVIQDPAGAVCALWEQAPEKLG